MKESEQPKTTLDDVLSELKEHRVKKKDFWDRLVPASTFISTVVLGIAGLWFTHSYNLRQAQIVERQIQQDQEASQYQSRILEMQTVEKFIPYLTADDEQKKEVALLVITSLGSPEFATQFAKLNPSKGTHAATDRIMASATESSPQQPPVVAASQTSKPDIGSAITSEQKKSGWAYLGHYVAQGNKWETRYFDFPDNAEPSTLVASAQTVRAQTGSINIRLGMPTDSGEFLKVQEVLKPGTQVNVIAVREWSSTGYMWAEISYAD